MISKDDGEVRTGLDPKVKGGERGVTSKKRERGRNRRCAGKGGRRGVSDLEGRNLPQK